MAARGRVRRSSIQFHTPPPLSLLTTPHVAFQACGELAQRLKGAGVDGATCLTFHAFALTVLRRFGDATERTAVKLSAARERGSNESTKNRAML